MMMQSIRLFEGYLKRVGQEPQIWDYQFVTGFLKVKDQRIVLKLEEMRVNAVLEAKKQKGCENLM